MSNEDTYGDIAVVKNILSVEENNGVRTWFSGDSANDNLLENALIIANAEIQGRLKKNLVKISGSQPILDTVANYYALAETLAPINTGLEDENHKSKYYNSRADELLENFIIGAIEEAKNSKLGDNPYSVSTTNNGSTPGEYLRD